MCGIIGIINQKEKSVSHENVEGMLNTISHRGPDGRGIFLDRNIGLGHNRLSIIDLAKVSNQPMVSNDGRFTISYNGEIYNYRELRKLLELEGFVFKTNSDTEVLLYSFIKWKEKCLHKFNGMFAFLIWDKVEQQMFVARDRYGIKPLYYTNQNSSLYFASENKAFDAISGFKREVDKSSLVEYMTFQNFFRKETLFKNVFIFPAGHFAFIKDPSASLKLFQFWDFSFKSDPVDKQLTEGEYLEELDSLVKNAVNRQLVSDVEIGSYLSGGMDSGSITAIAAKELPYIKTFTVGFDLSSASGVELAYDEREKAERMSYLFKTEHYEMVLKSGDMERCLPRVAYHLDEPRVGQSYPNFYAAKLASKFTKVVLSGCGGDEIFAGYPWRYYHGQNNLNFDQYIDAYYAYWQRLVPNSEMREFFDPIWTDVKQVDTKEIFRFVFNNQSPSIKSNEDLINSSLYFEAKTFLHGLLVVEDKLSMAHSLETRVPLLDNDLVDFGMKLPLRFKLNNLDKQHKINENEVSEKFSQIQRTSDGKMLFRKLMKKYIPEEVANREKQGFSAPDASWFKGESIDFTKKILLENDSPIYNYLSKKKVESALENHINGRENKRLLIWSLLNLHMILSKN